MIKILLKVKKKVKIQDTIEKGRKNKILGKYLIFSTTAKTKIRYKILLSRVIS